MNKDIQEIQLVCFRLDRNLYAADIMRVKEIVKPQQLAGLPHAPAFVAGVINLRGTVIPVLDLHKRFNLPSPVADKKNRLLIVSLSGQTYGLAVDEVSEVISVPVQDLRPPPSFDAGVDAEYLIAVCLAKGTLLMLLNLDKIMGGQESDEKLLVSSQ
jgi:purine-binding chemotaxis protein CheW